MKKGKGMEEKEKREESENIAEPLGCFFVCLVKWRTQTQRDLRENNVA